jgi:Asp-tRNA(Asn)/Glu-tRNA(Gln) amidotransferase C subunit
MTVSKETLKAIIRDYHGFDLSDEELELLRSKLENCMAAVEKLRELDLSNTLSTRLLQVKEGGGPDG